MCSSKLASILKKPSMLSQVSKTTRSLDIKVTPVTKRDQGVKFRYTLPWCRSHIFLSLTQREPKEKDKEDVG